MLFSFVCSCGNSTGILVSNTYCNSACNGNTAEFCGGNANGYKTVSVAINTINSSIIKLKNLI